MREKERRLEGRGLLLVGSTLFSMFLGASDPISPPNITAQTDTQAWSIMLGLALSVAGLPILGVVTVACSDGLDVLGSRVHPAFARVFTTVTYLAIGPRPVIPRVATTSSEMAVPPFVGADVPIEVYQLVHFLVFFAAALFIALWPERLTDRLGKVLRPILVVLTVVAFMGCSVNPLEDYGSATGDYMTHVVVRGFIEDHRTMDTIATLTFGIVIAVNIHAREVEEEGVVVQGIVRAGVVTGGMLLAVYCMLAHIGALSDDALSNPADGAEVLANVVGLLFDTMGSVLLVGIFLIVYFNVCMDLISSRGEYFHSVCPRLGYRGWVVLFALVSMVISNTGSTQILEVSVPILSAIYPVAIVPTVLSFFQRRLEGHCWVYPAAVLYTRVFSILFTLKDLKVLLDFLDALPLTDVGLSWVLPVGVGVVLDLLFSDRRR